MTPVLLKELRDQFRRELSGVYPREEIDSIFHLLTAHFFGFPRTLLAMEPGKVLSREEARPMFRALEDLCAHIPVQYITGRAHFMGMELRVTPFVLIPRHETAEMVRWILDSCLAGSAPIRVLDVGTGSGCIALGLKRSMPDAEVHAMDVSEGSLQVARENSNEQQLEICFHKADICTPGSDWPEFDLIVSNPPYIPEREKVTLDPHVAEAEPPLALFVADADPIGIYGCICRFATAFLVPGGSLYVEIHKDHGPGVVTLLKGNGFSEVVLKKDIFGRDRYVRGRWDGVPPGKGG